MNLFDLSGKVALVTGGSRGIGRAIALRMAEAGASVVISSRKVESCDLVVDEIEQAGGKAVSAPCNMSDIEALPALLDTAHSAFGKVDIMVGNAAVNPHYGPTTNVESEAFDKIFDTNVKSNLWLAKMVLPEMAERRDGVLIFVTSVAGLRGTDDIGVYGMSKAAETSMARSLAVGWGKHNIRVNCIAPGLIRTDFAKPLWDNPDRLEQAKAAYPLGRIGEPDDIAGVAVCLASPAGAFITGQTIVVDGGITMAGARG